MEQNSDAGGGLFPTRPEIPRVEMVFDPVQTDVSMNQYRLELLLRQYQDDRDRPVLTDAWPWLAATLAFLGALVPGEFTNYSRIDAEVWEALFIMATFVGSLGFIWRINLAIRFWKKKVPEPTQAIALLISEMRERQLQSSLLSTQQESGIPDSPTEAAE